MTDDQAERLIKEIRGLRHSLLGLVFVGAFAFCAFEISRAVAAPYDPVDGVRSELSYLRTEVQLLRGAVERHGATPPKVIPVPLPNKKE